MQRVRDPQTLSVQDVQRQCVRDYFSGLVREPLIATWDKSACN
jgi:hypothetical protein